MRTSRSAKTH